MPTSSSRVLALSLLALGSHPAWGDDRVSHERSAAEQAIESRDESQKGIEVGTPKVYDDSLLQQMLSAAETRLSSLQLLDQGGISSKLGSIVGATQQVSSFALSIQGPSLPQIATTNTGATNSTQTTNGTVGVTGTSPSVTTTDQTAATVGAPSTSQTTTTPQPTSPVPTTPAATTTMPSSFSVSASDLLNEQMQLTYEIANLRLLLEGSLSDRLVGRMKMVKPRVTLGFPITVVPSKRYKNAVAFVEVEVAKCALSDVGDGIQTLDQGGDAQGGSDRPKAAAAPDRCQEETAPPDLSVTDEPPAVMALLPQEKTYNVASIKESDTSIGAGIVTQVASIGGSFFHSNSSYFLIKDQDTLALTFRPTDRGRAGFLWQFRPVLGERYVREGLKQTFVQLAFASDWSGPVFGKVHVRTYWRCYDHKHNLVKGVIAGSLHEYEQAWPIDYFGLEQRPKLFSAQDLEDLGNGQLRVRLHGSFLGGTYVRVGSTIIGDGTPGFNPQYRQISFVASIADLASKSTYLGSRDGTETPLYFNDARFSADHALKLVGQPTLTPVDESNTKVTIWLEKIDPIHYDLLPLLLVIGGRAFGYSDAPLIMPRDDHSVSLVVPTSLLRSNRTITVKPLFTQDAYWKQAIVHLRDRDVAPQPLKLTLLEQGEKSSTYLLEGSLLERATFIAPAIKTTPFGALPSDTARQVVLTQQQTKQYKTLLLKTGDGLLATLPVPTGSPPSVTTSITPPAPILIGTDEIVVLGSDFSALQKVVFNGIELKVTRQADNKAVWLAGLKAAGVTATAKIQPLEFDFKDTKLVLSLTVVAGK